MAKNDDDFTKFSDQTVQEQAKANGKISKLKNFAERVDADLSDFKNYLDGMKEENVVARLFGLTKEKHKKVLVNDNQEELENDIKRYDKIQFSKK